MKYFLLLLIVIVSIFNCINSEEVSQKLKQAINKHKQIDIIYANNRCKKYPTICDKQWKPNYNSTSYPQIFFKPIQQICSTTQNQHIQWFKTSSNLYFYTTNGIIYDISCNKVAKTPAIKFLLCDRGTCQQGVIYFVDKQDNLQIMQQKNNFTSSKILKHFVNQTNLIGGIIRWKNDNYAQIFLSYSTHINVHDNQGRLIFSIRIPQEGLQLLDHHPYPLLLIKHQNPIHFIETNKYKLIPTTCTFTNQIKSIKTQNSYSTQFIALSSYTLYTFLLKTIYQCYAQSMKIIPIPQYYHFTFHSNCIYINNIIINKTDDSIYSILGCNNESYLTVTFFKSDEWMLYQCCSRRLQQCTVNLFKLAKLNEANSILIWMILIFFCVLLIFLKFIKKNQKIVETDDEFISTQIEQFLKKYHQKQSKIRNNTRSNNKNKIKKE